MLGSESGLRSGYKTAVDRGSDRKPLVAAAVRHTVKLGTHKKALEEAGDQGFPFTKAPLVFETTGAIGEETQKWWKSKCRDGGRSTHTRSTPEQTAARARAHVVSKG